MRTRARPQFDAEVASSRLRVFIPAIQTMSILRSKRPSPPLSTPSPARVPFLTTSSTGRSEIPLTFRLVPSVWLSAEAGVLACSDYDTGAPLPTSSAGRTIGAYAHLRVRVTFRPHEVCVFVFLVFLFDLFLLMLF